MPVGLFFLHSAQLVLIVCILKEDGCRAKGTAMWESGALLTPLWSTFDLVGFRVIWRSFGVLH